METRKQSREITLLIFPFENLSDGCELLCKSLSIDLITELSRFRYFRIISNESIKDDSGLQRIIGDYLIKGSFRYMQDHFRITAQLINCETNQVTWADHFHGDKDKLFDIQENVLRAIVSTLQVQLNYDLLTQIRKKSTVSLTAYELWLYGMEELKFGTVESDQRARGYFEKVIELEPAYSLAYSGMSLTFFNEWSCQLWDRWEISQKGAFEWAKKAIDLDDQNYIAATVLGRVFLYEGEYEKAEHYLRRAIRLNGNDTDNLIEIATSLIFLGYTKEAEELYEKVLQLNPLQQDRYDQVGALVAFESGYYEKCVALGTKVTCGWVDFPALLAAAYYHLGDETRMNHYWATFISDFQARITLSKDAGSEEGLEWIRKISPYKVYTNQEPFWEFLRGNQGKMLFAEELTVSPTTGRASTWMKEADVWKISFDGKTHYIRDMKGMHDLARLLQRPREEIHCSDLLGGVMVSAGKELMFDDKAKRSYQRRIQELEEQLLTVDHDLNPEKKRTLVEEYDQLMDHLSVSLGLGGRTRVTSDTMDRARSAVTWRIRKAIKKIEAVNPSLGKHLSNSVKTGLFCSYHPELSMDWQITS